MLLFAGFGFLYLINDGKFQSIITQEVGDTFTNVTVPVENNLPEINTEIDNTYKNNYTIINEINIDCQTQTPQKFKNRKIYKV